MGDRSALAGTATSSQSWDLDPLGNMTTVTTDGVDSDRTYNGQNEITALGGTSLAADEDGNALADGTGKTFIYDATMRGGL